MTTNDPNGDRIALAPFTLDAVEVCRQRIRESPPAPDFAAMLARVREIDPAAVPHDAVSQKGSLAPPIALARDGVPTDGDPIGARFMAVLRTELDVRLSQANVLPPARQRATVLFAAAAAVLLAVAVGLALVAQRQNLVRGDVQANANVSAESQGEMVPRVREQKAPIRSAVGTTGSPEPHVDPGGEAPIVEKVPEVVPPDSTPPRKRRQASNATTHLTLEEEAQALWQRGELAAAEQKYRQILRVAGRSRRAELAYADLFSLMRQSLGSDGQTAEWRAYLNHFPRGRFADDARGGLCQRASPKERSVCWHEYLAYHPEGVHRKQAEAALGKEANP